VVRNPTSCYKLYPRTVRSIEHNIQNARGYVRWYKPKRRHDTGSPGPEVPQNPRPLQAAATAAVPELGHPGMLFIN
jgi:hypothetical protein